MGVLGRGVRGRLSSTGPGPPDIDGGILQGGPHLDVGRLHFCLASLSLSDGLVGLYGLRVEAGSMVW